ncbi:MAG: hypothetical protein Q9200_001935 [Gallowayella weberi]
MAGMTPPEMLYQMEHILDDRSSDVIGVAVSMAVCSTAAVTARFICRRQMKVAVSYDDYLMLGALLFALCLCFIFGYDASTHAVLIRVSSGTHFGTGRHLLAVGQENTVKYLKLAYAFQFFYACSMTLTRLSILAFYHRLFPKESTPAWWRACHYAVIFLCLSYFVSAVLTVAFTCTPVSFYWTRTGNGHCVNEMAVLYSSAGLTIFTDILMLLLPVPIIWRLQMEKAKKIGVIGIFLLGGFVCVATIVRIQYIPQIVPVDPTWTQVNPGIWSTIEPCMGIVSACLPVIGPLLRTKLGSIGGSSWLSRSKRSGNGVSYGSDAFDRRNNSALQKKSAVSATIYSKDRSQSDEEMAVPLREIPSQR